MEQAVEPKHAAASPPIPFRRILPDDLGREWPLVERGLATAIAKCGLAPYTADELLQSIIDERTALYRHDEGFVVLAQTRDIVTNAKILHVCLGCFEPGEGAQAKESAIAWLDAMKLAHGCARIEFASSRAGWAGLAPHFLPAMTLWVRA